MARYLSALSCKWAPKRKMHLITKKKEREKFASPSGGLGFQRISPSGRRPVVIPIIHRGCTLLMAQPSEESDKVLLSASLDPVT